MAQNGNALNGGAPAPTSAVPPWLIDLKDSAAGLRERKERPPGKPLGRWLGDFLSEDTPSGLLPAEEKLLFAAANGEACVLQSRAARLWTVFDAWRSPIQEDDAPAEADFALAMTAFLESAPEAVQEVIHDATLHAIAELGLPPDWEPKDEAETRRLAAAQQVYFARLEAEGDPEGTLRKARSGEGFFLLAVEVVKQALEPVPGKPVQLNDKWFTPLLRKDLLKILVETRSRIDEQPRLLWPFFGELVRHVRAAPGIDEAYLSKLKADPTALRPHFDAAFDRYEHERWRWADPEDPDIRVRAGFLRFLCLGGDDAAPVHERGLELWSAYIKGDLDLSGCTIPQPLLFFSCDFETRFVFRLTTASFINLEGSRVPSLNGESAHIRGGLLLHGGFRSEGVHLPYAAIEGSLFCNNATFLSKGGPAIDCAGASVAGNAWLGEGFRCEGGAVFTSAKIGGDLNCAGGIFRNRTEDGLGVACGCDGVEISGSVYLTNGFRSEGSISFAGAKIAGALKCGKGTFINRTPDGDGRALNFESAAIGDCVFLGDGFSAEGQVIFDSAHVRANFECSGGRFDNSALARADGSREWNSRAAIAINLFAAKIDGILWLGPLGGDAFARAEITGSLHLQECHTHNFIDHSSSWPSKGVVLPEGKTTPAFVYLDGFTYVHLAGRGDYDASARKRWLDRQPPRHLGLEFRPQPFEQLIKVYREMGHDRYAREIAKFKERRRYRSRFIKLWHGWRDQPTCMRRIFGENWLGSALDWLDWLPVIGERLLYRSARSVLLALEWFVIGFGTAYGYGYFRLIAFFLTLWIAGGFFYDYAADQGGFAPSNPAIYLNKDIQAKCGKSWTACKGAPPEMPGFNAFIYSADIMLPVLDLGQKHDWQPIDRPDHPLQVQVPVLKWLPNSDPRHTEIPELTGETVTPGQGALDTIVRI